MHNFHLQKFKQFLPGLFPSGDGGTYPHLYCTTREWQRWCLKNKHMEHVHMERQFVCLWSDKSLRRQHLSDNFNSSIQPVKISLRQFPNVIGSGGFREPDLTTCAGHRMKQSVNVTLNVENNSANLREKTTKLLWPRWLGYGPQSSFVFFLSSLSPRSSSAVFRPPLSEHDNMFW